MAETLTVTVIAITLCLQDKEVVCIAKIINFNVDL